MLFVNRVSLALAFALTMGASARADEPEVRPLNFVNDIIPILTKADCNTGGCHAKAITGQRGFRLSLLGFEPEEDYEHIVKEGRGRRVFPPAPEQSLLLLKAANIVPHGGGKKLEPGSEGYQTLVNWIAQGMPYGTKEDPKITALEVEPANHLMKPGTTSAAFPWTSPGASPRSRKPRSSSRARIRTSGTRPSRPSWPRRITPTTSPTSGRPC